MKPWAGSCSEDFAPRQCCALTRNRQETGMARRNPRGGSGAVLGPGSSSDESPISLSTPQFSTAGLFAEGSWTGKESPLSSLTLGAQVPYQIFQVGFLRKGHFDQKCQTSQKKKLTHSETISLEKAQPNNCQQQAKASTGDGRGLTGISLSTVINHYFLAVLTRTNFQSKQMTSPQNSSKPYKTPPSLCGYS